ncbi:MAG: hypothetical protein D4R66_02940 [Opitutales bacterium]|nr:MAG: hypothetical protein D4R66_02940 [Opitutales bacterium]
MSLRTHLNLGLIAAGVGLLTGCAASSADKGVDESNTGPTAVKESPWYKPDWLSLPSWKIFGGEVAKPQPKAVAAKKTTPAAKDANAEAWNEPKAKPSNPEVSKDAIKPKPVAPPNTETKPKTETTVTVKTTETAEDSKKFNSTIIKLSEIKTPLTAASAQGLAINSTGGNAGGKPRIPLPFRLSEWISDEQSHKAWRDKQVEKLSDEARHRLEQQQKLHGTIARFKINEQTGEIEKVADQPEKK